MTTSINGSPRIKTSGDPSPSLHRLVKNLAPVSGKNNEMTISTRLSGGNDILCLICRPKKQFALTKCDPGHVIQYQLESKSFWLECIVRQDTSFFLLCWTGSILQKIYQKQHIRCILTADSLQELDAGGISYFTDNFLPRPQIKK